MVIIRVNGIAGIEKIIRVVVASERMRRRN
jgi:hypothetical protein